VQRGMLGGGYVDGSVWGWREENIFVLEIMPICSGLRTPDCEDAYRTRKCSLTGSVRGGVMGTGRYSALLGVLNVIRGAGANR